MVVVDASALIPLAWIGRLDLISETFEDVHTTEAVRDEVLTEGKRGTTALRDFLDDVTIHSRASKAAEMADLEGIAVADASVIMLADDRSAALLANDKGLIEVARTQGIDCRWVTTLLLQATDEGTLSSVEAGELLHDLVANGMNLHPTVYARVRRELMELGD